LLQFSTKNYVDESNRQRLASCWTNQNLKWVLNLSKSDKSFNLVIFIQNVTGQKRLQHVSQHMVKQKVADIGWLVVSWRDTVPSNHSKNLLYTKIIHPDCWQPKVPGGVVQCKTWSKAMWLSK
jgi:hypothetical protein